MATLLVKLVLHDLHHVHRLEQEVHEVDGCSIRLGHWVTLTPRNSEVQLHQLDQEERLGLEEDLDLRQLLVSAGPVIEDVVPDALYSSNS